MGFNCGIFDFIFICYVSLLIHSTVSYKPDFLTTIDTQIIKHATTCIEGIIKCCFKYVNSYSQLSPHKNQTLLLTFITTPNMDYPAEEIQREIIREVNWMLKWQIEIFEDVWHNFESFEYCIDKCGEENEILQKQFVPDFNSYYYIIIADSEDNVFQKIEAISAQKSFDPRGIILIYYAPKTCNSELIANAIFDKLLEFNIYRAFLMISLQHSRSKIKIYSTHLDLEEEMCGTFKLDPIAFCTEGNLERIPSIFNISKVTNFRNCTLNVVSNRYEPFVISSSHGFEVDVLNLIGERLNINFQIDLKTGSNDWGGKLENGFWNGSLGEVYNNTILGIGNIGISYSYMDDFDFSNSYFRENKVVVAPIAEYVPKWRVLTIIFTYEMWLIIFGVVIISGIAIHLTARYTNELPGFKPLHLSLIISFQLTLSQSLYQQPISQQTRVVVLSLIVFSMIAATVYTSYLINVLTNPVRESQISSLGDIVESGLRIGGLETDREIFNDSDDYTSKFLYENYILNTKGKKDTAKKWLKTVAKKRTMCTVASEFYVNYLMSTKEDFIFDVHGHSKIYIFKKKLLSYPVSMVMRKGFPLLPTLNHVIDDLVRSGLDEKLHNDYVLSMKKIASIRDETSSETLELTVDHVQGAFALLAFGYCISLFVFIMEFIVCKCKKKR